MSLFKRNKKFDVSSLSKEEQFGFAWLYIVGQNKRSEGLQIMKELSDKGFTEATIVLAMFPDNMEQRKTLLKKAADAGNPEGLWEYCSFLPHSYCPDPKNQADALWEEYCMKAAESGSVDAMNEIGNVFHRRKNYAESMYWYAMANAHGHPEGARGMQGIAREWKSAGAKRTKDANSNDSFNDVRLECALAYLDINAGTDLQIKPDDVIRYVMNGEPIAAYLGGDIFESIGNMQMACKMYSMIAQENDPRGMKCYADMLYLGRGVKQDQSAALSMYKLAAEAGDRESMFTMGEFTKKTNSNLAAYWYGLAHSRGYQHALTRMLQLLR